MKANAAGTRERILAAAYELFYQRGFHRTSLDDIAAKARLTKRTLYYHVASKDQLAGEMLEHRHRFVLEQMAKWIDQAPAQGAAAASTPAQRLVDRLFLGIEAWAKRHKVGKAGCSGPHWSGSGFTRMAIELADLPGHPARIASRQHKRAVEDELARRLAALDVADAPQVAAQIQMLLEGAVLMILVHGEIGYAKAAAAAAQKLL